MGCRAPHGRVPELPYLPTGHLSCPLPSLHLFRKPAEVGTRGTLARWLCGVKVSKALHGVSGPPTAMVRQAENDSAFRTMKEGRRFRRPSPSCDVRPSAVENHDRLADDTRAVVVVHDAAVLTTG